MSQRDERKLIFENANGYNAICVQTVYGTTTSAIIRIEDVTSANIEECKDNVPEPLHYEFYDSSELSEFIEELIRLKNILTIEEAIKAQQQHETTT